MVAHCSLHRRYCLNRARESFLILAAAPHRIILKSIVKHVDFDLKHFLECRSIRVSLNSKFINAYQQVDVAVFSVFWVESAVDPNMKSVIVVNGKAPEDDYFLKHIPAGEHIVHARVLRGNHLNTGKQFFIVRFFFCEEKHRTRLYITRL